MVPGRSRSSGQAWVNSDWAIAASLFLVTLISRIPFRSTLLYTWDSVLYARALVNFDVTLHQPQPPGHIFYVGAVWLVNRWLDDANSSMVWVSIFASAAAVATLYWLGRTAFSRPVGLLAALFLATSLSFWAYGEVAYPYTMLAWLSVLVAGLIYQIWQGKGAYVVPAGLALGLASGFRQDLLPFLLPLLLIGFWRQPWRRMLASLALLALAVAGWYVVSAELSGGVAAYREASASQSRYLLDYSSVIGKGPAALVENFRAFGRFTLMALVAALPLLLWFLLRLSLPGNRWWRRDQRLIFLAVWALPSILFYLLVHVGEFGYVFSFLPAVLLAAAWGLAQAPRSWQGGEKLWLKKAAYPAAAILLILNLALFLVLSPPLSANRLAAHDDILRSKIETIRAGFDPANTMIIAVYDAQAVSYYLPEFPLWYFDPAVESEPVTAMPPGVERIVLFEEYLRAAEAQATEVPLDREQKLVVLTPQAQQRVKVDWPRRQVILENS